MASPWPGPRLNLITGPWRAVGTTVARARPEGAAGPPVALGASGPIEPPGEWGPPAFTLSASTNIAASGTDTTTARLTAPPGSFAAGRRIDDSGSTPSTTIPGGDYAEHEFAIEALPAAQIGEVYEFRLVRDGGTELAYDVLAQWTIGSGAPTTNAPATVAPVTVSASAAAASVQPAAGSAPVTTTGQPAAGQVRPAAGAAAVALAAQPATSQIRPAPTSAPVTLAAGQPVPTVLAQAQVATIATSAADAAALVAAQPTVAPATVTGQAATVSTATDYVPTLLTTFAASSADPHSLTIPGATAGRDIYLIVNTGATVATPASWELVASRVFTMGSYIFRLPGGSNPGGSVGVSLDLSGARAVAAVALEVPSTNTGTTYASLVAPTSGPTVWGTTAHTFAQHDTALAIFAFHEGSVGNPTFGVSGYDSGFTAFADTGWAGAGTSGDEGARIVVGHAEDIGFTAGGVTLTLTAAATNGSAVGFLALDQAPAGSFTAGYAPVTISASDAAATVSPRAESAPVTAAASAPLATVAPQAAAGAATLTGQPATATVRAQAAVAAVSVAGQAATTNTSASTNANATVAPVASTGQPATVQVRALAQGATIGVAAPFEPGSVTVLQLVMDNPVGIGVTASTPVPTVLAQAGGAVVAVAGRQPTVSTSSGSSANPTAAPVTVTGQAPAALVRANAGVGAVGVAALQPAVTTANQTLAQAQGAAVGVVATSAAVTVRPAAGASSVITSAAEPLVQIAARPDGAAVILAALALLAQARALAAGAPVAVAGRNPVMAGSGATWRVQRGATLNTYRALLDGVHPTTATIT